MGSRVGEPIPKQLLEAYAETTVLDLPIRTYQEHPSVTAITIVCTMEHAEAYREIACKYSKVDIILVGGSSRQESSRIGTKDVQETYVLVHDVARPIVKEEAITDCIKLLKEGTFSAINTVFPVTSSMVLLNASSTQMIGIVPRENLALGQCPQGFVSTVLRDAHALAASRGEEHHEDCMMVRETMELEIGIVVGHEAGFKVTYPEDIRLLRHFVKERENPQGSGA
jgi:2-C-methyl-D-erythritol 4-phosphate cytidylyltransferase